MVCKKDRTLRFLFAGLLPILLTCSVQAQQPDSPSKAEFRAVTFGTDDARSTTQLNKLAADGWEYVGPLGNGAAVFRKRARSAEECALEQLQGTWRLVSESDTIFRVQGRQWITKVSGNVSQAGIIRRIEVKDSLNHIDLLIDEGSNVGSTAYSIYALEGDTLKYCWGHPRPTNFGPNTLIYRREASNDAAIRKGLEKLQGVWTSQGHKLTIDASSWRWIPPDGGQTLAGKLQWVGEKGDVDQVDLLVTEGYTRGQTCEAIFHLQGETLHSCHAWCSATSDYGPRPTAFQTDGEYHHYPWKRLVPEAGVSGRCVTQPESSSDGSWLGDVLAELVEAGAALVLEVTGLGCQTEVTGMTLPSPRYLQHAPQYIPPSPPFPLPRELASMEAAAARDEKKTPRIVILTWATTALPDEFPDADRQLHDQFVRHLQGMAKDARDNPVLVSAHEVEQFKKAHPNWRDLGLTAISEALGADGVITLEINALHLYDKGSMQQLLRGRASVTVTSADLTRPSEPSRTSLVTCTYPERSAGPVPAEDDVQVMDFRERFLQHLVAKIVLSQSRVECYSSDPNQRMQELLNSSEDRRQIEAEWERIWFTDQPSHLTPERVHGGVQP